MKFLCSLSRSHVRNKNKRIFDTEYFLNRSLTKWIQISWISMYGCDKGKRNKRA